MNTNKKCEICSKEIPKYKCPKCLINYCSLACYKEHKNNDLCLQETKDTVKTPQANLTKNAERIDIQFETEDTVPLPKLNQLGESKDLKDLLQNPHLRDMLVSITKAQNIAREMEQAMKEPIFTEFANKCLDIVGK